MFDEQIDCRIFFCGENVVFAKNTTIIIMSAGGAGEILNLSEVYNE